MKALITGAAGFCGQHLLRRLRRDGGIEIAGLDLGTRPANAAAAPDRFFQVDICDGAAVSKAVAEFRPDMIFHLASVFGTAAAAAPMCAVNVSGTVHVLEAAASQAPECRVLTVGSAAEYGMVHALPVTEEVPCRPAGAYGISKYAATLAALDYARRSGLKVVVARPFNIVGPGVPVSLVAGALMARAKQALQASAEPVLRVGDADSERDFVAVEDAVDAYVRLLDANAWGEVFNICSGRAWSIRQVAELLVANSTRPIAIECDPHLVPPSPLRSIYGSYEKAGRTFGYAPAIPLERALRDVWQAEMGVPALCA